MSILYTPCSSPHPSPFHRSPNVSVPHCFVLPTPAPLVSCPPCCSLCVCAHTSLDKVYKKKVPQLSLQITMTSLNPSLHTQCRTWSSSKLEFESYLNPSTRLQPDITLILHCKLCFFFESFAICSQKTRAYGIIGGRIITREKNVPSF